MTNRLFTKGHKPFLERMTNHIEIKIILSWKFLEPWKKSRILLNFLFNVKGSYEQVLVSPRTVEKLVKYSRIYGFVLYSAYDIIVLFLTILELS